MKQDKNTNQLSRRTMLSGVMASAVVGSTSSVTSAEETDSDDPEELLWEFSTEKEIVGGPVIVDQDLYVTTANGIIIKFDRESGEVLWERTINTGIDRSPTVVDGSVYVSSYDDPDDETHVYSLDVETGETEWKSEALGWANNSHIVYDEGTLHVFSGFQILQMSADDGEIEWEVEFWNHPEFLTAVHDGVIYGGAYNSHLKAIDVETGEVLWEYLKEGDFMKFIPIVHDGTVFIGVEDGGIKALDASTGDEQWSVPFEGTRSTVPPTITDGKLIYAGSIGIAEDKMVAVDIESESIAWRNDADIIRASLTGFTSVGDTIVTAGRTNKLIALDVETGDVLDWEYENEILNLNTSPIVVDGVVYVGNDSGNTITGEEGGDVFAVQTPFEGTSDGLREEQQTHEYYTESNTGSGIVGEDSMPGFGVASAIGALSGAAYLSKERTRNTD